MLFEFKGRCPRCLTVRTVWGYDITPVTPDSLDLLETQAENIGSVGAHCPKCDDVEDVAFFVDGKQTEGWQNAIEYEKMFGKGGGPLPPKPWRK